MLRPYVEAGVLGAADVHVARALARLVGEDGDAALLGAALAVRGPRLGHVCVDLAGVRESAVPSDDSAPGPLDLPWPEPGAWAARLRESALVGEHGPLRLEGSLLYLDRYWGQERAVAADLLRRAGAPPLGDPAALRDPLARLFPGPAFAEQSAAAATALLRRLSVIAGGPGTGKTTTIARILALVDEVEGLHPRRVALAAPTGKAAARLEESVRDEAAAMAVGDETRARLLAVGGSTIHRLLGRRPDSDSRFRHDRANPLPHTLVVVDEASMISLSLMARLLEAMREDARLVLVGDPEQLVSVEAGAVLGDVVGPARTGARMRPAARSALEEATGGPVDAVETNAAIGDGVVLLRRVHRFGAGIAELADAVRRGDGTAVVAALRAGREGVRWLATDPAAAEVEPVRDMAVAAGTRLIALARAGDAPRGARGARRLPPALRPSPRPVRGRGVDGPRRGVARGPRRGARGLVSGLPAAGGRQRLRPPPLQRRHRGDRRPRRRAAPGGVRAAGRGGRVQPEPGRVARPGPRDDDPQEPGLAVPPGGGAAASSGIADPDPRAALHGDHARERGGAGGGRRGGGPGRGRAPGRAGIRPAAAALGRRVNGRRHGVAPSTGSVQMAGSSCPERQSAIPARPRGAASSRWAPSEAAFENHTSCGIPVASV